MKPFPRYGPYVAIDFETSANSGACACALGMARMEDLEITATWYSLIRPASRRILYTRVHGLAWKDLANAPAFDEIWPEAAKFMAGARFLVAHNAGFDSRVLAECLAAYGLPRVRKPFLCTLAGARRGLRLASYSLDSVCAHLGIELTHHHAGSDAKACGQIHASLIRLGVSDAQMLPGAAKPRTQRNCA